MRKITNFTMNRPGSQNSSELWRIAWACVLAVWLGGATQALRAQDDAQTGDAETSEAESSEAESSSAKDAVAETGESSSDESQSVAPAPNRSVHDNYRLRLNGDGLAYIEADPEAEGVRAVITQAGQERWDVQVEVSGVSTQAGLDQWVSFRARSDEPRQIGVGVSQAHDPWDNVGMYHTIDLTSEWQDYRLEFQPTHTDAKARIHFDIGSSDIAVHLSNVSFFDPPKTGWGLTSNSLLWMVVGAVVVAVAWGASRWLGIQVKVQSTRTSET